MRQITFFHGLHQQSMYNSENLIKFSWVNVRDKIVPLGPLTSPPHNAENTKKYSQDHSRGKGWEKL